MRIPPLLVGLSLAANLGLAVVLVSKTKSAPAAVSTPASHHHVATAAPVASVEAATDADGLAPEVAKAIPDLFQRLVRGDFVTEIARLRASGMSEETVSMIAQLVMMQKFKKAYAELGAEGLQMWGGNYAQTEAQRALRRKFQQLQRKVSEEAREAGVDPNGFFSFGGKVPGLSADKAAQLARIEQDRQELRSQVHMDASGMMLDRDTERLKYIDEEFKKDLASVLSPEELEAWRLNRSETAQSLRGQLGYMSPTDEEFKKILKLQDAFNEAWPASYGGNTDWQKRSEAERAMKKQIAEALGPERAVDYQKATDYEFGTLSNLEYRLELPKGTAERIYGLHQETDRAAQKIRSDKTLDDADRKEALKVLAEQVKTEMTSALGEEGLKAYRAQNSHWIDSLER